MTTLTPMQLLREQLRIENEKKNNTGSKKSGDRASYPFWDINYDAVATIRFLPDADASNPYFSRNKQTIKLPFEGQIGGEYETKDTITVTVPCVDMFTPKTCPIIAEISPWWKQGPEKEALARQYYKKQSWLYAGFVVQSPFEEKDVPENPIRRFVINKSINDKIVLSLMDTDMNDLPTDFTKGCDFRIRKTRQGDYANYTSSDFARNTRSLSDDEMAAIEAHGLYNLSQFLGPRPDADGITMIKAMFHDSLAGLPFDFASYGHVYRGYGLRGAVGETNAAGEIGHAPSVAAPVRTETVRTAPVQTVQPTVQATVAAPVETVVADSKPSSSDILDRIRKRTQAAAN